MIKNVYGYTRVSTARQGQGVSLIEQKTAIERYASQNGLEVVEWFEEQETAAKQGRPLFSAMMKKLRKHATHGVIIHKIDRGARNLKDWAEIGELIDKGIEIHFAHESLDMHARGGRLSADIQAVIAADYVRNLRQEIVKGIYGRLKQGFYPFKAPIGYLDTGSGNAKKIDLIQGPLVKKAFELYATKKYTLETLLPKMSSLGLRNYYHKPLRPGSLASMLHNRFYTGIIRVKGQCFKGLHEPLVTPVLFQQVQDIFARRTNEKVRKHVFFYRKTLVCSHCGAFLIGERQKGHTYYRCHTNGCKTTGLREVTIDRVLASQLSRLQLLDEERDGLEEIIRETEKDWASEKQSLLKSSRLQLAKVNQQIERLTDAFLDGAIERDTFELRKERLYRESIEREATETRLQSENNRVMVMVKQFMELAKDLGKTFKIANSEEKSGILKTVFSNFSVSGKTLEIQVHSPYFELLGAGYPPLSGP